MLISAACATVQFTVTNWFDLMFILVNCDLILPYPKFHFVCLCKQACSLWWKIL